MGQMGWALLMAFTTLLSILRVARLRAAGHIGPKVDLPNVLWIAFVQPVLRVLGAGLYEMLRTMARGKHQKPPLDAFLLAGVTGKAQPVPKTITVTEPSGEVRRLHVTEWVRPPRPLGRPSKYPEGWQAHRRTGRSRGRPRKAQRGECPDACPE